MRALAQDKAWQSKRSAASLVIHSKKVDSSKVNSASAECMDCHATATALARNDRNNTASKKVDSSTAPTLSESAKDSRTFTQNAPSVSEPQAAAVEMRNRGFQGAGEGIYLSGNEQARAAESTIYRSNATPKPSKAESPQPKANTQTAAKGF